MSKYRVSKYMYVSAAGMNHYGVAKLILENMEVLRKKDHNVQFRVQTHSDSDNVAKVCFLWSEEEEFDA